MELDATWGREDPLTCHSDTLDIIRNNPFRLDDTVELRAGAMQHDGIETDSVQETQAESEFVDLVQYSTSNLDDGEFSRL